MTPTPPAPVAPELTDEEISAIAERDDVTPFDEEWHYRFARAVFAHALAAQVAPAAAEPPKQPRLIGWRTADYLMETSDPAKAKNWEVHYQMLPIFEGDSNTKLAAAEPNPNSVHSVDERAAFEAAMRKRVMPATLQRSGDSYAFLDLAWFAWQARAALAAPVPQAPCARSPGNCARCEGAQCVYRDGSATAAAEPSTHDLIVALREKLGLFAGAMPISPKAAWDEALALVHGPAIWLEAPVGAVGPAALTDAQIDAVFSKHFNGFVTLQDQRNAARELLSFHRATTACKGKNCGSTDGRYHSAECHAEHDAATALDAGVPPWPTYYVAHPDGTYSVADPQPHITPKENL